MGRCFRQKARRHSADAVAQMDAIKSKPKRLGEPHPFKFLAAVLVRLGYCSVDVGGFGEAQPSINSSINLESSARTRAAVVQTTLAYLSMLATPPIYDIINE